jgi:aminopeptidase N
MKNLINNLGIIFFTILAHISFANALELEFQEPHLGSDRIDVQSYSIKLIVSKLSEDIAAEVEIVIKAKKILNKFGLHFDQQHLNIQSLSGGNYKYHSFKKGFTGKHGLSGDVLKVYLKQSVGAGDIFNIKIKYIIGHNKEKELKGFIYTPEFKGSEILNIRSWPYYTRFWLPSNDHPGDVALFSYELHVPRGNIAVANGELANGNYGDGEGLDKDNLKIYKYNQKTLIPTYATNIVIGDFETYQSSICYDDDGLNNKRVSCNKAQHVLALNYFYPKKTDKDSFIREIEKAADSLVFYSKLFKNYAFKALGFVTAPHPFNMESVNLITLVDPDAAVHEVLHQWWGNTVYFRHWGDFWISEGLTSYFTGYYDEYLTGINSACHQRSGVLNHGPNTDPLEIFDNTPYCKGSDAIAALRQTIANLVKLNIKTDVEKEFFNYVMKEFYNKFRYQKLNTEELIEFFRSNLLRLAQFYGYNLNQFEIDIQINTWKNNWFNL